MLWGRAIEHLRRLADWLGLPRNVDSQEPLAAALLDHLEGGRPVELTATRGEGFCYPIGTAEFFSLDATIAVLDSRALHEARGRVLDVGAGAGRHALALQERGLEVVALDVSPTCVEIMRSRGVEQPVRGDVFALDSLGLGEFDTILLLMQSIGIAGSRLGVETVLEQLRHALRPGGQVLLDSSPLRLDDEDEPPAEPGEVEVSFDYRNLRGRPFPWIYLAEQELAPIAESLGWRFEVLERQEPDGEYLARLVRAGQS